MTWCQLFFFLENLPEEPLSQRNDKSVDLKTWQHKENY